MTTRRPYFALRALSGVLAFLIGFGPITPLAYAATPLADGPINVNIQAKPNIVYTMDDSTSMQLDFLPDYVVVNSLTNAATTYCRAATGLAQCGNVGSATMPQFIFAEWGMPTGAGNPWPAGYGNGSNGPPAVMTSSFNALFYNPAVTYTAPLKYDGSSYADMSATNTTNWTKVPADPYLFPTKYVNLQNKVAVGVWCNTSYAGPFTLPTGAAADRDGLTIGGDYCRINGFPYAAGANGAPATAGDYSYPYADNVNAGVLSKDFFATTSRTIYCDPDRMNGTAGSDVAEKAPSAPTCDACAATCAVAQVVDPDNPPGCDVGCTNPAECTICGKKCPEALSYNCTTTCTTAALDCSAKGGGTYAKIGPKTCPDGANEKCTAHPGACATKGAWTPDAANCSTIINGKSNVAWVPSAGTIIGTTRYEQDANGAGDVCRRNNFTYSDITATGWTYPSGKYTKAVTGGGGQYCGAYTASINRHYYKAAVQWCDTMIGVSPFTGANKTNDKWRGFGKGTCQAEKTTVYKYPKFVKYGADLSAAQDNYTDEPFYLVELDFKNKKIIERNGTPGTSISHVVDDGAGGTTTITRDSTSDTPAASELVNYANWFAYYRTRIIAAKTVTSLAFSELTDKFRVGFHTLSNVPATTFLTVKDFTGGAGGHREAWFGKLAGVSIPMGNDTPTLDGVVRIGDWFRSTTGTSAALSGSEDPIKLSCQKNFHMLFTDGYTNQNAKPASAIGNMDVDIPDVCSGAQGFPPDCMPEKVVELPMGPWPNRFHEGATAVEDSLADYALGYWMTDLRPSTVDKKFSENNVPTSVRDPANWQHLNFAALSLGTEGNLSSLNVGKTEGLISSGTLTWPTPSPVYRPGIAGVDDLWHAAVNGRSLFVNARDPQELQRGMTDILKEAENQRASRAGAAFSSVSFGAKDNFIYRVTIEPGWSGTLTKVEVDPLGEAGETTVITSYHDILELQVTPASAGDTPWYDKRNVVTWNPESKKAVAFKLANLTATQQGTLGATAAAQQKVVDYLRGDRSNEGTALKNFRVRPLILGDIDNSSPVVVGVAKGQYSDSTDPGYEAFKAGTASRKKMVYVGANDGMLHAFDEATGTEVFGFIPSLVYSSDADKGLAMLTKKEPFFKHQMFVDATPVAADVNIGGTWKTYLIGGLGKGGKGYYAIDVTDPGAIKTEADAAGVIKWEFTDAEMGYSYGKPLIAKTYADGWVAILPTGYDATGKAGLYFVKLSDGSLIRKLETSASGDAGLAQVAGFTLTYKNQFVEQIYGGDLNGDVWRFDVSNNDASKWTVDKFAELRIDGKAQSVTMAPQIEVDLGNGVDRYVMVGTGRLLHEDDLLTYKDQTQTMYVIRDGTVLKPTASGSLPYKPRGDADFTVVASTSVDGFSGLSVKGWYMDLPAGQRIVTPIAAELGLVGWAGSKPPENECLPGLEAYVYVRKFTNGESVVEDGSGTVVDALYVAQGAVGMEFINVYSTTPNDPTLKLAITLGTDGKTMYIDLAKSAVSGDHRMSWRLLGQ